MLKAKILFVGPCESGKTVLANFLTESSDITEYSPTQGVPPLNKLKLVHSNLEDDPEEIRMEFIKYLKSIINSMSESRDREEMSIMT
uniref:Intraflagellar transport 22 n=1 Tax=Aotus nancymaae TaxID=37293 RepID=A0A2K5DKM9_AOTNA